MSDTTPEERDAERTFQRARVIFEQDCQEFRSLNSFLWQIPVLVSTLTGGLWFGASKVTDSFVVQSSLFLLAGVANITFIIVLWRLRKGVMEPLLTHIATYQGRDRNPGKYTMIWSFTALLVASSGLSFLAFGVMLYCRFYSCSH